MKNLMNPMSAASLACHRALGTTPLVVRDRSDLAGGMDFAAVAPNHARFAITPVAGTSAWSPPLC
ncbi:hypothetical protein GCM10027020_18480 [Nocardioides salsibiostraticola]